MRPASSVPNRDYVQVRNAEPRPQSRVLSFPAQQQAPARHLLNLQGSKDTGESRFQVRVQASKSLWRYNVTGEAGVTDGLESERLRT